ncbi:hypothetical protein RB195_016381 [Necator americanus]|uniref:DNA2/NAM7 helicase-like C-terminal domain-containing protein n=1 Tax=Necator americanus TaxID=51031 RepID=A0ABR1E995_NECAM
MSEEDKEEYAIAEHHVSQTLETMIKLMLKLRPPHVLSLLNTMGTANGTFAGYGGGFRILIAEGASQIPEPVLVAFANRLPPAQQVYIGDINQLEPHVKCGRNSNPATYGARSIMGVLVNGLLPEPRPLLLSTLTFPTPTVPFMFVNVDGRSERAANLSHRNSAEAKVCLELLRLFLGCDLTLAQLCIITFYREQYRLLKSAAKEFGVELSTADSVQGREKEVVILLTIRTHVTPESAEFLDEYKRMNVALSRCRQGQFILGHLPSVLYCGTSFYVWSRFHRATIELLFGSTTLTMRRLLQDVSAKMTPFWGTVPESELRTSAKAWNNGLSNHATFLILMPDKVKACKRSENLDASRQLEECQALLNVLSHKIGKMKANSLTNMLGEFVAIQKTPEFKPCSASMQELNRAVKEEKRTYSIKHRAERPRFSSVGDLSQEVSLNPTGEVTMRTLCDKRRERPSSLIERIRQRISPSRKSEAITEVEEEDGDSRCSRKFSTRSAKLYIPIV